MKKLAVIRGHFPRLSLSFHPITSLEEGGIRAAMRGLWGERGGSEYLSFRPVIHIM
ncbi:unnamed protein product [marine sediment metagenome]|uniref:Uncharacterized protein n=1 Tax=marine sediment metagenome TaxID=412755 RepID=X0X018_9ZZZZ